MLSVFLASDFDRAHQPFKGDLDQAELSAALASRMGGSFYWDRSARSGFFGVILLP